MLMRDTMADTGFGAAFFWISFVLIKSDILLQIIVAVIFEKLEAAAIEDNLNIEGYIYKQSIRNFVETWE